MPACGPAPPGPAAAAPDVIFVAQENSAMNPAKLSAIFAMLAAAGIASGQAPAPDIGDGYLCCNMRTDGAWISDSNYASSSKTIIPAGTPVGYGGMNGYAVAVDVQGKRQSLGNDYSRDLKMEDFARRYIVKKDPKPKIAAAAPKVRTAIHSMRITKGMTRDQVLIAMGYPISSYNPHMDAPMWKYWLSTRAPFTVVFNGQGRVARVETDPDTLVQVYLE
jgi:hypothetical protein